LSDVNQPDYLPGNIDAWQQEAANYVAAAERAWSSREPYWGIWQIPESEVGLLPQTLAGLSCVELGCGTAYVSAWMCRRGGEVAAIDPTPNQLQTARRLQREHGLEFEILEGFAERLPFADASFDFAVSEYGACLWADPYLWIPEAARVLKPGGKLVFLTNSPLLVMCTPDFDADGPTRPELLRPYFGMHAVRWPDDPGTTEFHLPHGEMIELLRSNGLLVERLAELKAPSGATTRYPWANPQWAEQWPSEEAWFARKVPQ
jgi:SAM-dependent methyltransferase